MIRYYVEYLENATITIQGDTIVFTRQIEKGVWFGRGKGHRTKKEALADVYRLNKAAGREIARYHGPLDEKECGLSVRNLKA